MESALTVISCLFSPQWPYRMNHCSRRSVITFFFLLLSLFTMECLQPGIGRSPSALSLLPSANPWLKNKAGKGWKQVQTAGNLTCPKLRPISNKWVNSLGPFALRSRQNLTNRLVLRFCLSPCCWQEGRSRGTGSTTADRRGLHSHYFPRTRICEFSLSQENLADFLPSHLFHLWITD